VTKQAKSEADIKYGMIRANLEASGYTTAKACRDLTDLIISGDWQTVGEGFPNTTAGIKMFLDTLDQRFLSLPRELRVPIEAALSAVDTPQRAIATALGVSQSTVNRDLSEQDQMIHDESDDQEKDATEQSSEQDQMIHDESDDQEIVEAEIVPEPEKKLQSEKPKPEPVMLSLRTHDGKLVPYKKPQAPAGFNYTTGEGISWASWSWNPVTGCLHGCDYCYARAIAARFTDVYPAGFTPLFHEERLEAPKNMVIPEKHRREKTPCQPFGCPEKRVFVCSMADLYGRWVPDEWIQQVHEAMLATSDPWEFLLLTKFPQRYAGLKMPPRAWLGTSVDEQKRVRIAENAFREVDAAVKWLSLEPLLEPLEFSDLSMFDWVVIGAQTVTQQPGGRVDAFAPPWEWVCRITAQAKEAGCKVHWKHNLYNGQPGHILDEYPDPRLP
jgi:protein gp37